MSKVPTAASVRKQVSPEEWQARVDLAAAYRLVAMYGWDDLIFTHISSRVPGTDNEFLINPYGHMFEEITASSLVKVDQDCNKLMDTPYEVNPAGFTIHSCIHAARDDAHCVMHVHSLNGVAVSCQEHGLLPISQQALVVGAGLSYHDYEGIALNEDEKPRLVEDLGKNPYLMLRNHGLLTAAPTPADAFLLMYTFEAACTIQVRALAGGKPLVPIAKPIRDEIAGQVELVLLGLGGELAWPGLLRKLDRHNPGYDS